ncbi:MAG: hypothetical protein HYZ49_01585 [Chloroflexi bacterium]|nr:hypothetical protein [Chloroflexota bacterium]
MNDTAYITIPSNQALKKESGWKRIGASNESHYAVRCHFVIRERQLSEPVKMGEIVDAYTSVKGLEQKKTRTIKVEHTTVNLTEALRQSLLEEEALAEFTSALSLGLGSEALGKIAGEVAAKAQGRLSETFSRSFKVQRSQTARQEDTIEWEFTVDPKEFPEGARIVLARGYKKHAYDFYLALVDYLQVEYVKRSLFSKLERVKSPPPTHLRPSNIIRCNLPLASIQFWKPLRNTFLPIPETVYQNEVEDPLEIKVLPLTGARPFHATAPIRPSLYKLSNFAFPAKR